MTKAIKVTSLIGIILQAIISVILLLLFLASVAGLLHPEFKTTVNGEVKIYSPEEAQSIFNGIFEVLFIISIISLALGLVGLKFMSKKMAMSATFYIIGAILSFNFITFVSWIACGVLIIQRKKELKNPLSDEHQSVD